MNPRAKRGITQSRILEDLESVHETGNYQDLGLTVQANPELSAVTGRLKDSTDSYRHSLRFSGKNLSSEQRVKDDSEETGSLVVQDEEAPMTATLHAFKGVNTLEDFSLLDTEQRSEIGMLYKPSVQANLDPTVAEKFSQLRTEALNIIRDKPAPKPWATDNEYEQAMQFLSATRHNGDKEASQVLGSVEVPKGWDDIVASKKEAGSKQLAKSKSRSSLSNLM